MTWVQIDDAMADHPKIMQLGHGAFRVQVEGLCYANRNLTDGFVPHVAAHRHGKRYATELVTAGVWDTAEGGYQIHDYHDYQPTKAEVLELREKRQHAGKLGARRRWARSKTYSTCHSTCHSKRMAKRCPNPQSPIHQPLFRSIVYYHQHGD